MRQVKMVLPYKNDLGKEKFFFLLKEDDLEFWYDGELWGPYFSPMIQYEMANGSGMASLNKWLAGSNEIQFPPY